MTLTWQDLEAALAHEDWNWIAYLGHPVLFTPGDGSLGVRDSALLTVHRAALCREGFAPTSLPGEGRFWLWRPAHARRQRDQLVGWGVAHQRDQRALHVLRDVLHADPEQVSLVHRANGSSTDPADDGTSPGSVAGLSA